MAHNSTSGLQHNPRPFLDRLSHSMNYVQDVLKSISIVCYITAIFCLFVAVVVLFVSEKLKLLTLRFYGVRGSSVNFSRYFITLNVDVYMCSGLFFLCFCFAFGFGFWKLTIAISNDQNEELNFTSQI